MNIFNNVYLADLTEDQAIRLSEDHAINRMGIISSYDERRIYCQAKQKRKTGSSMAKVIAFVYSEAAKCACERGT